MVKSIAVNAFKGERERESSSEVQIQQRDRDFAENPEARKLLEMQADRTLQGEQETSSKLSEAEFQTSKESNTLRS